MSTTVVWCTGDRLGGMKGEGHQGLEGVQLVLAVRTAGLGLCIVVSGHNQSQNSELSYALVPTCPM